MVPSSVELESQFEGSPELDQVDEALQAIAVLEEVVECIGQLLAGSEGAGASARRGRVGVRSFQLLKQLGVQVVSESGKQCWLVAVAVVT